MSVALVSSGTESPVAVRSSADRRHPVVVESGALALYLTAEDAARLGVMLAGIVPMDQWAEADEALRHESMTS